MVVALLFALGGYLLGTLPTAVVVGRRTGHDPTREGSRNPGATNVYRTVGWRAGALVLGGDLLKGVVAAGAGWLAADHLLGLVCGAAAVTGHVLPVHRRFRGGKGVATAGGVTLVLFPAIAVAAVIVFVAVAKLARRVSIASLLVVVMIPVGAAATGAPVAEVALLVAMSALIVVRHAGNIARLARGTESEIEVGR